ncbi:MAG TPA: enolase C-terminal domain-like protein [Gaiellaceae bacterium]|nr:enolase C-terminal domain-like protein [Gaiellaceae bacterium]
MLRQRVEAPIESIAVSAYRIPTDEPESDGTFAWTSTTLVLAEVSAGGATGIGWTYGAAAAGAVIDELLAPELAGLDALSPAAAAHTMRAALRNAGYPGIGATAASAVEVALRDLEGKLLELPLASLLGTVRTEVPVYGSGGFCSYSLERLTSQLAGWVADGIPRVKMKVGREPDRDVERVRAARAAIGDGTELYVDANGAHTPTEAPRLADAYAALGVTWFEEPVSSDDVDGLRFVRRSAPAGMDVAAGEYASTPDDFRRLLGAVDCLQADATRCGGIGGVLAAGALCDAHDLDLSGHCAPTIHMHVLACVPRLRHLEWFHDHVRVEQLLFDGAPEPRGGAVAPDLSRPGLGVELKRADAKRYAI